MTALNDIYEVKHKFRDIDNKLMENVYFYRLENENPGGLPQSEDCADIFNDDIVTPLIPLLPAAYVTYEIAVRNLFDPADSFIKSVSRPGTRSIAGTELLPSFLAGIVTANVTNGLVRKGRKMLAGLIELDQSAGIIGAGGIGVMAARAALYAAYIGLLVGGQKKFAPVVVKRIRTGTPGNYTYRLPENQLEAVFGYIQSTVASLIVSSQDTRKK